VVAGNLAVLQDQRGESLVSGAGEAGDGAAAVVGEDAVAPGAQAVDEGADDLGADLEVDRAGPIGPAAAGQVEEVDGEVLGELGQQRAPGGGVEWPAVNGDEVGAGAEPPGGDAAAGNLEEGIGGGEAVEQLGHGADLR